MQKFICPHCGKETEYKEGLEFTFCKNCGGKVKVSEINSATGTVKAKNKSQTGIIIAAIALLVAVIAGLICFFALKNKDDSKKVSHKIETTAEDALSGLFGDDETTEISEITTILESTVTVPSTTEKITVPVTNPKVTKPKATKPKVTKPKVTKPKPVATTQKNQKPTPTKPATTKPVQKLPTTKSEIIKAYNDGFKVALTPCVTRQVYACYVELEGGYEYNLTNEAENTINVNKSYNVNISSLRVNSSNISSATCEDDDGGYLIDFTLKNIEGSLSRINKGYGDYKYFVDMNDLKVMVPKILKKAGMDQNVTYQYNNSYIYMEDGEIAGYVYEGETIVAVYYGYEIVFVPVTINGESGTVGIGMEVLVECE